MSEKHHEGDPWAEHKEIVKKQIKGVGGATGYDFDSRIHPVVMSSGAGEQSEETRREYLELIETEIDSAIQELEEIRVKYQKWAGVE